MSDISAAVAGGKAPHSPQPPHGTHDAQTWLEGLLSAVGAQRAGGVHGKWQCPGHARSGAHTVALGVGTRTDGTGAWVVCHYGCRAYDVLRELGLTFAHLRRPPGVTPQQWAAGMRLRRGFPAPKAGSGTPRELGFRHEAYHLYGEDFRKERLRHPTTGAKAMQWEARNHRGEWVPGLLGTREADLPLYRERDVTMGIALGETILLVESESSVDALRGWYATTWAGGASSPPLLTLRRVLLDHPHVVFIADHDEAGHACARRLRDALPLARMLTAERAGEDARDVYRNLGPDGFAAAVARALRQAPARRAGGGCPACRDVDYDGLHTCAAAGEEDGT